MWSVVTESPSSASARAPAMSLSGSGSGCQPVEEWRPLNVGRLRVPGEAVAFGDLQRAPAVVAVEHLRVALAEHVLAHRLTDGPCHLLGARPDLVEVHGLAVAVLAERLGRQVDVHRAGQRVGDDERRRGQVVQLRVGVDPPFEVAVARQHRGNGEVALADLARDLLGQRARVADARRAAIADQVEAERLERRGEAGSIQVVGDDHRPRGQRRLDPRLRFQSARHRVASQQSGADHHRGV